MNWLNSDLLSGFIKKATDILFVLNPRGTSLGVLLGVIVYGIVKTLIQSLEDKINILYCFALGIFAFNLREYLSKEKFAPEVEQALQFIKVAKKQGIPESHIRIMYKNLYEKVLQGVELDTATKNKVSQVNSILNLGNPQSQDANPPHG